MYARRSVSVKKVWRNGFLPLAIAAGLAGAFPANAAVGDEVGDPMIVTGSCMPQSMISYGDSHHAAGDQKSRFYCDKAVIAGFKNNRVMIQFANTASAHGQMIGYAGTIDWHTGMVEVERVYFEPGKPTQASNGFCNLSLTGGRLTGMTCGARADEGDSVTIAITGFVARP